MKRILLVSATLVFAGIATSMSAAQAKPVDRWTFDDQQEFVEEGFCGDQTVHIETGQSGGGVGRVKGRDRDVVYTVRFHGEATITNLATGRAFYLEWDYIDQEARVTYNGDGTNSVFGNSAGSERTRGPDGQLLDTKSGLTKWMVLLDDGGTPRDPSDDEFIDITFFSGPRYEAFCDDFIALTA